jgi:GDP/UDP-N,N'-diacetylbacillosamine 2-epimerase (hydrolysing)
MKQVAYLTGTRAEFGLIKKLLKEIDKDNKLELFLMATGMHLMDQFGQTISEVSKEFKPEIVEAIYQNDNRASMAEFLGICTVGVVKHLVKIKPGVVLVLGDRAEQLAMAQGAAYLNIPVVHLHGGEETTTIDDKARKAISMLADWHLPASKKARKKLMKMGVDKKRIKVVGAPGLDEIKELIEIEKKYQIVVLQHPDENETKAQEQITETLRAVVSFELPVHIIYPNADAGSRKIIDKIETFKKNFPKLVKVHKSLNREEFLNLLSTSKVLVGNSSSALIEAPSVNLAAVNVGPRQLGRERGNNIVDVDYDQREITLGIEKAIKLTGGKFTNPYGDGKTTKRVIKFLKRIKI